MNLSENSWRTLRAVVDRIVPADDFPGAWEAGFPQFFVRLMEREPEYRAKYEAGIPMLEQEAIAQFQLAFAELDSTSQDALLQRLERGEVQTEWPFPARRFFNMVVQHVSESFYADTGNGGNLGEVSWHMIGYIPSEKQEALP